jgi:hypothetical protein
MRVTPIIATFATAATIGIPASSVAIQQDSALADVMKNGRLYDGNTLNEVWPTERPLALPKYWTDVPNTAAGVGR